jgi:hypothetical protein
MYADDIILMFESFDGFQNMLNTMSLYTEKWGLAVNAKKKVKLCSVEVEHSEMMKNGYVSIQH